MKHFKVALKLLLFMTVLTGLIYPLLITGFAKVFFAEKSEGQFLENSGKIVGSKILGQSFESPKYFWGRPSATRYDPLPSGGSNLAPTSLELKKSYEERKSQLRAAHPDQIIDPPQDLLFTSASGLDPDISPEGAQYQVTRVALARGLTVAEVDRLLQSLIQGAQWGIFGESRVNVLVLNKELDRVQSAP